MFSYAPISEYAFCDIGTPAIPPTVAKPLPYPSWSLDADCNWQAPVAMPTDGKMYSWDEAAQSWVEAAVNG